MSESPDTDRRDRVTQAAEMVAAQANCSAPEALLLMEARADETGRSIEEIAEEVVEHEVRFNT
jgi:AmiR/NasT family two-component response regulator